MVCSHCMLLPEHMQNGTFHHRPHITGICRLVYHYGTHIPGYMQTGLFHHSPHIPGYMHTGLYRHSRHVPGYMQTGLYHGPYIPGYICTINVHVYRSTYAGWSVPSRSMYTWGIYKLVCTITDRMYLGMSIPGYVQTGLVMYLGLCRLVSTTLSICNWVYAD